MTHALTVVTSAEVPAARCDVVTQAGEAMWGLVARMFTADDVPIPTVRVVLTDDVMAAAGAEGDELGLPPDRRTGSDRLGGVVGGKALVSLDGTRASVVVHADQLRGYDGIAELWTSTVIAHEFGHLYYAALRNKYRGCVPDTGLPWEMAEILGLLAAEEFRVDRFAMALVETVLHVPIDDAGTLLTVADVIADSYVEGLRQALPSVVPGLLDTIYAYRTHQLDLEMMWARVARTSEEVTLFLAHTDAHLVGGESVLDLIGDHEAVSLLKPMWEPLRNYFRKQKLFPEHVGWKADADQLKVLGRNGWLQAWERLGLRPRPEGDGFFLAVGEPSL